MRRMRRFLHVTMVVAMFGMAVLPPSAMRSSSAIPVSSLSDIVALIRAVKRIERAASLTDDFRPGFSSAIVSFRDAAELNTSFSSDHESGVDVRQWVFLMPASPVMAGGAVMAWVVGDEEHGWISSMPPLERPPNV